MKRAPYLPIATAVFLGVLGALQVNKLLEARREAAEPISWREGTATMPVVEPAGGYPAAPTDFREAAKRVIPSVVSVDQYNRNQSWFDDSDVLHETGTGSGVVISKNGVIVTNNHVVEIPRDREHNVGELVKVRLPDK